MRLKILGSNSHGNCYILENENEALLIECGVRFTEIKSGMNFNLSKISGCLISHEHKDHCMAVNDVIKAGIPVYCSKGTAEKMGIQDSYRFHQVKPGIEVQVGNFDVLPFETTHDAKEPCCFMIHHPETGNILFLTDTYYSKFKFRNMHQVIVEANYCMQIINDRIDKGESPEFLRSRIVKNHMSLSTCKDLLRNNDLSSVSNIVLIHLSDGNSNAVRFKKEVQGVSGKVVHVAEKGMVIDNFNRNY